MDASHNNTEENVDNGGLAAEQVRHLEKAIEGTRELIEAKLEAAIKQLNQEIEARDKLRDERTERCTDRIRELETKAIEQEDQVEQQDKRLGKVEGVVRTAGWLLSPVALWAVLELGKQGWAIMIAGPAGG